MIPYAALTGPLPKLGVVVVALLAARAVLASNRRAAASAMIGALVLAPLLLLTDIWHSPQLSVVHRHPLYAGAAGVLGAALVLALALVLERRPALFAVLAVAALPFRIPISAGGATSNLLVPLYLVVAAGSVAFILAAFREAEPAPGVSVSLLAPKPRTGWLERLVALYVVLYGIQAVYSSDFEKALQQIVFFYVPFSLLFCLLARMQWSASLLRQCLIVVAALAVAFALIGFVEYATKTLLLNPKLVAANDVHACFTVNSVFFDPDIFGRFLALIMILLLGVLISGRRVREQMLATGVIAVLWGALVLTLSRSSLGALLVGMGVLGALRWRVWPVLTAALVVVVLGTAAVTLAPKTFGLNQGFNGASSGRAGLVTGGLELFAERPLWGWGPGAFVTEYRAHHRGASSTLSASHTIPITIAAEQGLIGEVPYVAFVLVAGITLVRGARRNPARATLAAAFLALVFHTMLYADFLEDPVTWALLGVGAALATGERAQERVREHRAQPVAIATA